MRGRLCSLGIDDSFAACVDGTFDVRGRMMALDPLCVEMIEAARGAGASANYTGSGGAIVAVCRDEAGTAEVEPSARQDRVWGGPGVGASAGAAKAAA